MNDIKDLFMTYENAGLKIISDDECCQLLAWLSVWGNYEEFVLNKKLNACIMVAQKRLKINSGFTPDLTLLDVFQNYIQSITDHDNPPEWVKDLEKRYIKRQVKK